MINTINRVMTYKGKGVVYIDCHANVLNSNELASKIFRRRDGLLNRAGKFSILDKEAQMKLSNRLPENFINTLQEPIFARRKMGGRPYKINIFVYDDEWIEKGKVRPHAVILVTESEAGLDFPTSAFREFYGLTKSEITLVEALGDGMSLGEYAESRTIKVTTVRWTVKNIFSKTGVSSQMELLHLILRYSA